MAKRDQAGCLRRPESGTFLFWGRPRRQLVPAGGVEPDVLNYAWRDYGNRVGVWRMLAEFERLNLPVAVLVNSEIYDYCPQVMDAFRQRGDEIVSHGRTNSERQSSFSPEGEARSFRKPRPRLRGMKARVLRAGWGLGFPKAFRPPIS